MVPASDFTDTDQLLLDEIAVVGWLTDMTPSVTPASPNIQSQPSHTFLPGTPMGTLLTQVPYFPPQRAPDPWTVPPQATIAPFESHISAMQWNDASGVVSSAVGLTQLYAVPPVISQPLQSPPLAQSFALRWVEVPQRTYGHRQWDFKPSEPIFFSVNGLPGINLGDALRKHFTGLDGRDDPMFEKKAGAISCRLLFPGYPSNNSAQISTLGWTKDRVPITRSKLVYEIAKKLDQYLKSMAGHPMKKSVDQRWKIGEGSMRLENMWLVHLVSVSKGSFQPEIWVVDSLM